MKSNFPLTFKIETVWFAVYNPFKSEESGKHPKKYKKHPTGARAQPLAVLCSPQHVHLLSHCLSCFLFQHFPQWYSQDSRVTYFPLDDIWKFLPHLAQIFSVTETRFILHYWSQTQGQYFCFISQYITYIGRWVSHIFLSFHIVITKSKHSTILE